MGWVWLAWLAMIAGTFGIIEWAAIRRDRATLSECVWRLAKAWPPIAVVFGMLFGGLAVHFFWIGQGCGG